MEDFGGDSLCYGSPRAQPVSQAHSPTEAAPYGTVAETDCRQLQVMRESNLQKLLDNRDVMTIRKSLDKITGAAARPAAESKKP